MADPIRIERCFICDAETGRAGRHDDSLFDGAGDGPYCEECWAEIPEKMGAEVERLRREVTRLEIASGNASTMLRAIARDPLRYTSTEIHDALKRWGMWPQILRTDEAGGADQ